MVVEVDVQGDVLLQEVFAEMSGAPVHIHIVHIEILVEFAFGAVTVMGRVERTEVVTFAGTPGAFVVIDVDVVTAIFGLLIEPLT